jgi:hypothetical protein
MKFCNFEKIPSIISNDWSTLKMSYRKSCQHILVYTRRLCHLLSVCEVSYSYTHTADTRYALLALPTVQICKS